MYFKPINHYQLDSEFLHSFISESFEIYVLDLSLQVIDADLIQKLGSALYFFKQVEKIIFVYEPSRPVELLKSIFPNVSLIGVKSSPSNLDDALITINKQIQAAKTIQKWFLTLPFRQKASQIINGHENELSLMTIDLNERKIFIEEVKNCHYKNLARRKKLDRLALSALKANKINDIETQTIIEINQFIVNHGRKNIKFLKFVDDKFQPTTEGYFFLKNLYRHFIETFPSFRATRIKLQDFLKNFLKLIQETPPCANLFYCIDDELLKKSAISPFDDYHNITDFNLFPGHDKGHPRRFLTPSYAAHDILGSLLFSSNWVKKEYRIGALTIDDIDNARIANLKLASISASHVSLPLTADGEVVSSDGFSRHDEYHRQKFAQIEKYIRKIQTRIQFLIRTITKLQWSHEIWRIVDGDFKTPFYPSYSREALFYLTQKSIREFNVDLGYLREVYGKESFLKLKGEFVLNKNATSPVLWIMVMDMVDNEDLWQEIFAININHKDITYDHHIALYRALKKDDSFSLLDVKQKIVLLDKIYHSYDNVRQAYEPLQYPSEISMPYPKAHCLFFKKYNHKTAPDSSYRNVIYIQESSEEVVASNTASSLTF